VALSHTHYPPTLRRVFRAHHCADCLQKNNTFNSVASKWVTSCSYYDKFLETVIQGSIAKGWKPPLLGEHPLAPLFAVFSCLVWRRGCESVLSCAAVALAFREQLMEAVPMSAHDQRVDIIVTADDIHYCRPAA
jgi:hypothetical protein